MVAHHGFRPEWLLGRMYPSIQCLNAVGFGLGLLWYWPQLLQTSPWLLPFVPDCPVAALLLLLALRNWRSGRGEALQGFAISVALFYAVWTLAVLLQGGLSGGALDDLMLVAHVGLALEAVWLWQVARPARGWRLGALWVAANTFVDYALGTHPALPEGSPLGTVALATAFGAVAMVLFAPAIERVQ